MQENLLLVYICIYICFVKKNLPYLALLIKRLFNFSIEGQFSRKKNKRFINAKYGKIFNETCSTERLFPNLEIYIYIL